MRKKKIKTRLLLSHFLDSSYGVDAEQKVLIAYASEFGTTREVADVIAQSLAEKAVTVDVKWVENIKTIHGYDAVIVGSAIQYDKWMPEAINFVRTHQSRLNQLPVAFFFTCLTLSKHTRKTEQQAMNYSTKLHLLLPQVKRVSVGRFAGALDYKKMSFAARSIAKCLYAILGISEGDYRDWHAIRAWAQNLYPSLISHDVKKNITQGCNRENSPRITHKQQGAIPLG